MNTSRCLRWASHTAVLLLLLCGFGPAIPARAAEPALTVELSEAGPTISPHLYGQFIEHLGRCIYDGIWAEMLRDRKFLLPPGASWEAVKPTGADVDVSRDATAAFAGRFCFAVWVRDPKDGHCGIRQANLGLVAGKEYVGHAVLAHAGERSPVELRLSWGAAAADGQTVLLKDVTTELKKHTFRFRAGASTDAGALSLMLSAPGRLHIGCVSLMPADNVRGMRADTLALLKKLAPPLMRWPGGNFVSGYDWKDGVGDRDRRPPRWERAWNDVESNDFGLDEFLALCAAIHSEPYIAVNSGLGSASDAADQVEYANGSPKTRWGGERAKNGREPPYGVSWWGVGNEMYGDWQLGHMPVEHYAKKHNEFVRGMKERDPTIRIVAVGNPGRWNDAFLPACAANMDLLSGHHYTRRLFRIPFTPADARKYEANFPEWSGSVARGVRAVVEDFKQRQGKGKPGEKVRLAVDEWGIVRDWSLAADGPGLAPFEHYYCLGDALATGRGLHELIRSCGVVTMANWAQTVNVIGAIKTSRTHAILDPTGHVLALYRAHLGGALAPVRIEGDVPVDAVAGWDRKSGTVAVAMINYSPTKAVSLPLRFGGAFKPSRAEGWRIAGPALGATNIPGRPEEVSTTPLQEPIPLDQAIPLPARSVTLLVVKGN